VSQKDAQGFQNDKTYTEDYHENNSNEHNKLSTSSRIARELSLSSDKLDKRDCSSFSSVARIAFSP
jgi:hypothetical protein